MKKILALLMTLMLVLCFASGAMALTEIPEPEAQWGASKGSALQSGTLESAIDAANKGEAGYIRLLKAPEGNGCLIHDADVIIDLNGVDYVHDGYPLYIYSGDVTLEDSKGGGSVTTNDGGCAAVVLQYGSLTINGGTYVSEGYAVRIDEGEAQIKGGSFEGSEAVMNAGNLTITGGSFEGRIDAVYNSGNLTITGGSFEGDDAVDNRGSLTITGGSFEGEYAAVDNEGNLTITGGSFARTNTEAYALFEIDWTAESTAIRGGSFYQPEGAQKRLISWSVDSTLDLDLSASTQDLQGWWIWKYSGFDGTYKLPEPYILMTEDGKTENLADAEYLYIRKPVKVTFDWNGGKGDAPERKVWSGTQILLPGDWSEAPAGKAFIGWSEQRSGGELCDAYYTPEDTVTLYAQWADKVTITLDWNGGKGDVASTEGVIGVDMDLPWIYEEAPAGMTLVGWSEQKSGGEVFDDYVPEKAVTLYAQWDTLNVTVNLDWNGGDGETKSLIVERFGAMDLPEEWTKAPGHNMYLKGWSEEKDGGSYFTGTYYPSENMTLYAVWDRLVTVTFDWNGGDGDIKSRKALPNSAIALPNRFTKAPEGKQLAGWVDEETGGYYMPGSLFNTYDEDVTLTADWSDGVTITFDWNGGEGRTTSMTAANGAYVELPKDWTKAPEGLYFAGWSEEKTGGEVYTNTTVSGETTLYAQWGVVNYIFHENEDGSGRTKTVKASPIEAYVLPGEVFEAKPGKFFEYWEDEYGISLPAYNLNGYMGDIHLFPVYGEINPKAIYVGGKKLEKGDYIDNDGVVTRVKPAGGYAHYGEDGVLILSGYAYSGRGKTYDGGSACVYAVGPLVMELIGENLLCSYDDGICVWSDGEDEDSGDLVIRGSGSLTVRSLSDCIYADDDIYIHGGTYVLEGGDTDGIEAEEDLTIYDATLTINAGDNGLEVDDELFLYGGRVDIVAGGDGILVEDDDLYICGGTVNITAADDGIENEDECMYIYGGKITIDAGDCGLWAQESIDIYGGELEVISGKTALYSSRYEFEMLGGTMKAFSENGTVLNVYEDVIIDKALTVSQPEGYKVMTAPGKNADRIILTDKDGKPAQYLVIGKDNAQVSVAIAGEKTVKVPADSVGASVILRAQEADIAKALGAGTKNLIIDLSGLKGSHTSVALEGGAARQIASSGAGLNVKLSGGMSAELDGGVMKTLAAGKNAETIRFAMFAKDAFALSEEQKLAVGDRAAYHVFLTKGGQPVSKLGGEAKLSAPYALRAGEKAQGLAVCYMDESGMKTYHNSQYDEAKSRMTWTTDHFSVYVIDYVDPGDLPQTGDDSRLLPWIAMLAMAGAALLMLKRRDA